MFQRIITGDCCKELIKVDPGTVRCLIADPPYNIGVDYGNGKAADRLPDSRYLAWCEAWMRLCRDRLTPDGSLWVAINDEYAAEFGVMLKHLGLYRRNWIKWYETFGVNCTRKFNRTSRHFHYFTRSPKAFVFNLADIAVPSARLAKYNDKRANPNGKAPDDVWQFPRVAGTHKERVKGVPTQLPVELTNRIVKCASNPGDLVLDPFLGSGTTGVSAAKLGREFIGIESNPTYAGLARARCEKALHDQRASE